jgi:hypothetical protein
MLYIHHPPDPGEYLEQFPRCEEPEDVVFFIVSKCVAEPIRFFQGKHAIHVNKGVREDYTVGTCENTEHHFLGLGLNFKIRWTMEDTNII